MSAVLITLLLIFVLFTKISFTVLFFNFSSLSVDLSSGNTSCRNVFGTLSSVYGSPLLQTKIPLQQKILLATMLRLTGDNCSATVEKGLWNF